EAGPVGLGICDDVRGKKAQRDKARVVIGYWSLDEMPNRRLDIETVSLFVVQDVIDAVPIGVLELGREWTVTEVEEGWLIKLVGGKAFGVINALTMIKAVLHDKTRRHVAQGRPIKAGWRIIGRLEADHAAGLQRQRRKKIGWTICVDVEANGKGKDLNDDAKTATVRLAAAIRGRAGHDIGPGGEARTAGRRTAQAHAGTIVIDENRVEDVALAALVRIRVHQDVRGATDRGRLRILHHDEETTLRGQTGHICCRTG